MMLGACAGPTVPSGTPDQIIDKDMDSDASAVPSTQDPQAIDNSGNQPADGDADAPSTSQDSPAQTWKGMRVGSNFWFLGAGWAEDAWKANVDFATTDDPWNPAFIGDLTEADYAVFRFMDFGGTNNSPIRNWSERTQKTSADNEKGGDVGGHGIAFEWMFDLCNKLQKDCWINVPHLAVETYEQNPDENYFIELAKLAKATLDPNLTLYIEWSNETWNGGFQQALYAQQRGTQMGFASDAYGASFKFHVYASSRMYDAFVKVFGNEISRVKWVVAGQLGSNYGTQLQLDALKDPNINLGGRTPDYYASSNYVGIGLDGASPQIDQQWHAALAETITQATGQAQLIADTGMKLVAYEGGQHLLTNADVFARNPAAYNLYTDWLDEISKLFVLTMHYTNSGMWASGGAWGAKEHTGAPLSEAPKARALVDWIHAHQD
jgi:hypothetical protein